MMAGLTDKEKAGSGAAFAKMANCRCFCAIAIN